MKGFSSLLVLLILLVGFAPAGALPAQPASSAPAASPSPAGAPSPAASPMPAGSPSPAASPSPARSPSPAASPSSTTPALNLDRLTLEGCLRYARDHHPALRVSAARYAQAVARVQQSKALYAPNIHFDVSRSHDYLENGGLYPAVPNTQTTTIQLSPLFTLEYAITDGGKRRLSVERDVLDLQTWRYDWRTQWRKLSLSIELGYLTIVYNRSLFFVAEENVKMTRDTLKQAEGLYRAGRKSRYDVLQAQADLEGAHAAFLHQMAILNQSWADLEARVGAPLNPFAAMDDLYQRVEPLPRESEVIDTAFRNRSDVLSYASQMAVHKKQIEVNKTELRGALSTLLNYGFFGTDYPLLTHWKALLAWGMPLNNGQMVKSRNQEVVGQIEELLSQMYVLRLEILDNLRNQYIGRREAEVRVKLTGEQVGHAQEAYKLAFRRYRTGISDFLEVTNARDRLNRARSDQATALRDRKQAELQLFSEMEKEPLP